MDIDIYQSCAQGTDQKPGETLIPILGLAGEAGSLLSEYKKHLRDGSAHRQFKECIEEELGDLLWYVANIATKFDLSLNEIAVANLQKNASRWGAPPSTSASLDDDDPTEDQLPREFEFSLAYTSSAGKTCALLLDTDGKMIGDPLTDNAYVADGYRFHDIIHLAFAAKLGWSPVLRKLLNRKRKSPGNEVKDEIEDGARATAIEEAVSTVVAEYAERHDLSETSRVDWSLLKFIKRMTSGLEVSIRTEAEWEDAIVCGVRVWRELLEKGGGRVRGSMINRTLQIVE